MIEIIPAVLTKDIDDALELFKTAEGKVDRIQIDIIDGVFAGNRTIDPDNMGSFDTSLAIDYHLMVKEPVKWVEKSIRGMADRIIGHIELMSDQFDFIDKVQTLGLKAGLALDLSSPIKELEKEVLKEVDLVLLMSVPAGFGGQEFSNVALDKIDKLKKLKKDLNAHFLIQDDGGVNETNIALLAKAGVDEVVVGRRIYEGNIEDNLKRYQSIANHE